MRSVKVVHIVEGFTGGLVTYMTTVLPGLVNSDRSVTLIYSSKRADPDYMMAIETLQDAGVRTIELGFDRKIGFNDFFVFLNLLSILRKGKFDVVHTHCSKAGFLGRIAARCIGTKVICHSPHCFISSRTTSRLKAKIFLWLDRMAAFFTHKMIFVSESERLFALENRVTCPGQCEVINNGLAFREVQDFDREVAASLIEDEGFCVTFAGRLVKYKNADLLINAAALLENDSIKFMICGNGSEFKNLEKLISDKGLEGRVSLTGYIQDMSNIYSRTDVFVMCSDAEGQPYALLEAMAHGCSCIGVKSAGITDVLEHGQTGLLCENSANDVAKSIDRLISDIKLRDKLAKNAKRYVANSHSQKTQIASLNSLYDQMLPEAS